MAMLRWPARLLGGWCPLGAWAVGARRRQTTDDRKRGHATPRNKILRDEATSATEGFAVIFLFSFWADGLYVLCSIRPKYRECRGSPGIPCSYASAHHIQSPWPGPSSSLLSRTSCVRNSTGRRNDVPSKSQIQEAS